jgi:tRNA G18 (ribose-2'-O)-methylase SpoU
VSHPALCVVSQTSQYHSEVSEIIAECEKGNAQCLLLPDGLSRPLSQVDNGVDIVFLVLKPVYDTLPELLQNAVLLDRIQDPGNVGSILRSVRYRSPVAWLLGHEGGGISESLMERATDRVVIPHASLMESLDVAACAAYVFLNRCGNVCLAGNSSDFL